MGAVAQEEIDALLIQLAQRTGGIEPLLHGVFSFLKRKTDFYYIQQPGDRIGFPPGKAKNLVLEAYERFESDLAMPGPPKSHLESRGERIQPESRRSKETTAVHPSKAAATAPSNEPTAALPTPHAKPPLQHPVNDEPSKPVAARSVEAVKTGKVDPKASFVPYNGGECAKYRWSQTLEEIVMFIDCCSLDDQGPLKAKQVKVDVKRNSLKLTRASVVAAGAEVVVEGDLFGEIKEDEVVWHMEHGRYVTVTMEKRAQTWWKSALIGDDEIDTQKVDSTRQLEEYDEGTQAAIRKIMFDQNQKIQGLPTSDELQQHEMLRKAWDAEGSPFAGTPFDPSLINLSGGGGPPGMPLALAPDDLPP